MAFNALDMLPNENVELTVQHLDMLACCDVLSQKAKEVCGNASTYLRKLVMDPVKALKPIASIHGQFFGSCPNCKKSISASVHPHFCGYCGSKIEWEGWEE